MQENGHEVAGFVRPPNSHGVVAGPRFYASRRFESIERHERRNGETDAAMALQGCVDAVNETHVFSIRSPRKHVHVVTMVEGAVADERVVRCVRWPLTHPGHEGIPGEHVVHVFRPLGIRTAKRLGGANIERIDRRRATSTSKDNRDTHVE